MTDKKTHVETKEPTISVRYLADYMAASERKKRTIAESCKFRPLARLLQHKEAKTVVASALLKGIDIQALSLRADVIRSKLADDDFDALTNESNADYVKRFSAVASGLKLPTCDLAQGSVFPPVRINGVRIAFSPQLLLEKVNLKTNKVQCGALMLRYAKGKSLSTAVAEYQSAAIFGLMQMHADKDASDIEKGLCLTLDAYSGEWHKAPGASATMWANMKAACESIAERWPAIKSPKNSVV